MSRPAVARIDLDALRHNLRLLIRRAGSARLMAVIKANAYGHGLDLVAPALMESGCNAFAITDADEGAALRRIVGQNPEIVVLSGVFDAEDARWCGESALIPVLTDMRQIALLRQAGFRGQAWLKVDTGMCRLGAPDTVALHQACRDAGIGIAGLMSHLACADMPDHPLNRAQLRAFRDQLEALPERVPASLLNSAGLAAMPEAAMEVVRPGIALYGVEPVAGRLPGLKPVMQLTSRIMQVRDVRPGESVSYGATFTASRDMRIAVVAMGYADGLPRLLSNRGAAMWLEESGHRLPVVGRICMDYCLLDVTGTAAKAGDRIEFWGARLPATEVAAQARTIAYELFTGVGARVTRLPADAARPQSPAP